MILLLDETAVGIETTGESRVVFATGFRCGYRQGIEDLARDLGSVPLVIATAFRERYQSVETLAFRVRSIKAYRTSL